MEHTLHTFNLPHPGSARGLRMFVTITLFSVSVLVTCFLLIGCKGESHSSWEMEVGAVLIALLGLSVE